MPFECNTLRVSGKKILICKFLCHYFKRDVSHHPLVPSYWLSGDSWHRLSGSESLRWEQMVETQTAQDRHNAQRVQGKCFHFCFIWDALDASTWLNNCRVMKIRIQVWFKYFFLRRITYTLAISTTWSYLQVLFLESIFQLLSVISVWNWKRTTPTHDCWTFSWKRSVFIVLLSHLYIGTWA